MPCRIGITTNPERRRKEWEHEYPQLKNWTIIAGPYREKSKAQAMETRLALEQGCHAAPGGDNPHDQHSEWIVYRFEY